MKKIALFLMVAAMVLVFVACGSSEPAANSSAGTPPGAESLPTEADGAQSAEAGIENAQPAEAGFENAQPDEAPTDTSAAGPDDAAGESRILVAYFSATNNTAGIAQKLADGLGADMYEIMPEQTYTDADLNYGDPNSRTSVEMNDPAARPAISGEMPDLEQYDVVFIGYPIWWGEAPRIMNTFIESGDFSGKTLVAFCTSASSGFGSSDSALRTAAGTATWLDGHRFSAGASAEDVLDWANGLGIQ